MVHGILYCRKNGTAILFFSIVSGDIMSQKYHLYCKYFLIKHKPFIREVHNSQGGPIPDHEENYDSYYSSLVEEEGPISETILEDDHPTAKQW